MFLSIVHPLANCAISGTFLTLVAFQTPEMAIFARLAHSIIQNIRCATFTLCAFRRRFTQAAPLATLLANIGTLHEVGVLTVFAACFSLAEVR